MCYPQIWRRSNPTLILSVLVLTHMVVEELVSVCVCVCVCVRETMCLSVYIVAMYRSRLQCSGIPSCDTVIILGIYRIDKSLQTLL